MPTRIRALVLLSAAICVFFLYFYNLSGAGMLGPDEPRYAAIGRAMADTGDWITPRLWGTPWFEKPALLYWMTAAGCLAGLGPDLAPRLPVALLSAAFLVFFWCIVRREFDTPVAVFATIVLGTSAGWIAYSRAAVTDLPLSVFFGVAMLLALRRGPGSLIGLFLGCAVLAKGLVPVALFVPALWFLRARPREVVLIGLVASFVAAPWYVLVTWRNGTPFLTDFFLKQHLARFTTDALQHVRPMWFYIPVLAAAAFPWTPALTFLFQKSLYAERNERFLLAWLVWGLVFFSMSANKLPGYLLPLLPALALLIGIGVARANSWRWVLALCAGSVWLIPPIASLLPQALASGLSRATFHVWPGWLAGATVTAILMWWLGVRSGRLVVVILIGALCTLFVGYIAFRTYPILNEEVSARPFWEKNRSDAQLCSDNHSRSWRYGLNYYAGYVVPDCPPAAF